MGRNSAAKLQALTERLAAPPPEVRTDVALLTVFSRGGLLYGVALSEVVGAARLRDLSPIPDALPWMAGVVSHQGEVITLVDLVAFWGLPRRGVADLPTYLVVTDGVRRVGLLVEGLLGVREMDGPLRLYEGVASVGVTREALFEGAPVAVLSVDSLLRHAAFQP